MNRFRIQELKSILYTFSHLFPSNFAKSGVCSDNAQGKQSNTTIPYKRILKQESNIGLQTTSSTSNYLLYPHHIKLFYLLLFPFENIFSVNLCFMTWNDNNFKEFYDNFVFQRKFVTSLLLFWLWNYVVHKKEE